MLKNNFVLRILCFGSISALLMGALMAYPKFTAKVGGIGIQNNDIISKTPAFDFFVVTATPLVPGSISLVIDKANTTGFTTTQTSATEYTVSYTASFSDGTHSLTVEARDTAGNKGTFEASGLIVNSASSAQLNGTPLNFPNPFDPTTGTSISYYLTKNSNITLNIYDSSATLIAKKEAISGASGGSAGYNETLWDGKSGNGDYVGNGMYLFFVIADGKVIGKGKMVALRR